ncbi:MAG: DMT family transporter [Planctomycetes bacterium]|nr:DMT family transporter [Planctomycetota bacterium]
MSPIPAAVSATTTPTSVSATRERVRSAALSGALMVLASAVLFSTKGVAVKCAFAHGVDAVTILGLRMAYALPVFLAIAWYAGRGQPPLPARTTAGILALGVIGYYLASLLDVEGLAHISVGLERTILFIYPTVVVAVGAVIDPRSISARLLAALAVTYAGIVLTCLGGSDEGPDAWTGIALVAASAVVFAAFVLASPRVMMMRDVGSLRFTAIAISGACVTTLVHLMITHPLQSLDVPMPVHAYGVYLAIGGTVIPAFLMGEGMRRVGPQRFAALSTIGPAITVLLAWMILGETPTAIALVGMAMTTAAVTVMTLARAAPAQASTTTQVALIRAPILTPGGQGVRSASLSRD